MARTRREQIVADLKAAPRGPLFKSEGPEHYAAAYKHNQKWAKPSETGYQTPLNDKQEGHFRDWLRNHREDGYNPGGFNPNAKKVDYDLRGYWQNRAKRGLLGSKGEAGEGGVHFTDRYKTPYDTTFSNESKYAKKGTPFVWRKGNRLVNRKTGRVIYGP